MVGMRTLILLRHAKSSWDTPVADADRPLSARGRRDATAAGELLAARGARPDAVVVSSSARTRETWALVAESLTAPEPTISDALYGADKREIAEIVRGLPATATTAVLVGHFPGVPDAVEYLAAGHGDRQAWEQLRWKFPTAGMATLRVDGDWDEIESEGAELVTFDIPRG